MKRNRLSSVGGLVLLCLVLGCDDAVPGPIGGVVFVIRPTAANADSRFNEVDRVEVTYSRVEVLHRANLLDAPVRKVLLDSQERTLVFANVAGADDVFVAQFQVPVGFVTEFRFFPKAVTLHLHTGAAVTLDPDSSDLPSWQNSGWKGVPADGSPFEVRLDELTGVRGLLGFEERLVRMGPPKGPAKGWKMKPTFPAQYFDVNPLAGEPGVFADQLTVVFHDGTPLARISEINEQIGGRVLIQPVIGAWYRIKLSARINAEEASRRYLAQPEVSGVMPAVDFAIDLTPDDNRNPDQHDLVQMAAAWDIASDAGTIGRSTVVAAVIDPTGFDMTHPDLFRNVWINQGELPVALFDTNDSGAIEQAEIARFDTDPPGAPDGLITIRDLQLEDGGIRPADINDNRRVDGVDLIYDTRWANGINEDQNGISPTFDAGFVDDLVGWDFSDNDRDPSPPPLLVNQHGTAVASVLAAEGNNGTGMAGVVWRASIVAVRASNGDRTLPAENYAQAIRYIETTPALVVVNSASWNFARKGYDAQCGLRDNTTLAIDPVAWDAGIDQATKAYGALFGSTSALYVFSAGNSAHFLENERVFNLPQEAVWRAIPNRTLLVGNAQDGTSRAGTSNYGAPVEIWAPGQAWNLNGFTVAQDGTSFAAPLVAGAALLLASHNSQFSENPVALKPALLNTATPTI